MAVISEVLVELYNRNGQRSLRVIDGQGYESLNIRFDKDSRDDYPLGSVFKMDLRLHSTGKYYVSAFGGQTLNDTYFSTSVLDPVVVDYIAKKGGAAPAAAKPAPRPSVGDNVPNIPAGLRIDRNIWQFLNHTIELGQYPMLLGPKGCGKSSTAKALAEARGMDFYEFDLGQVTKPNRFFLGGMVIGDDGTTKKVRSEFFKAFTSERPTLIFLDEITRVQGAAANFLMTVLAKNQSFVYDMDLGKRYDKGSEVVFCSAGNNGYQYTSTGRIDSAFEDRFVKIPINYLSQMQEKSLLMEKYPDLSAMEAEQLTNVARALREAEQKRTLTVSLSTRQVLAAAAMITLGYTVSDVVQNVILTNYIIADELKEAQSVVQAL